LNQQKLIPLMVPDIQQQDIDAVVRVLKSGMLIQGEKVLQFEKSVADFIGVKHAVAVSNGTATLHMALVAAGITVGDEVIVPAFSYISTANVVELVGATPIFVDIDIATFNIDTSLIEKAITNKTKAIIPVHEFGLACDIIEICEIAKRHKLIVIEDAACALGASENGKLTGTFGYAASFSFHPRKAVTSGEGGMLVTNDDEVARKFRILRNHGIEMQDGKMEFIDAGFNYRLTDFQAALVNSQFNRFSDILSYKTTLAFKYFELLKDHENIICPTVPNNKIHTWQSFHIIVKGDRAKIIAALKEKGIGTNYGAQCMPFQKYFKEKYKLDCESLYPNAMHAYTQGLVLPLYERMSKEDAEYVAKSLIKIYEN
jgi:perosamine synthetase